MFERRAHARPRRQVDHGVRTVAGEDALHFSLVPDIGAPEQEAPGGADGLEVGLFEGGRIEIVQVIDHDDVVPPPDQGFGHVRSDESGAAGHKNFHRGIPFYALSRPRSDARPGEQIAAQYSFTVSTSSRVKKPEAASSKTNRATLPSPSQKPGPRQPPALL